MVQNTHWHRQCIELTLTATEWLTLGQWTCFFTCGPKLTLRQPNDRKNLKRLLPRKSLICITPKIYWQCQSHQKQTCTENNKLPWNFAISGQGDCSCYFNRVCFLLFSILTHPFIDFRIVFLMQEQLGLFY